MTTRSPLTSLAWPEVTNDNFQQNWFHKDFRVQRCDVLDWGEPHPFIHATFYGSEQVAKRRSMRPTRKAEDRLLWPANDKVRGAWCGPAPGF
ncbi:hypothetical protein TNCV_4352981 [Trichonephila clavipes]|nr:hypothetical protein TNCV_4352981 [Trichonephila clavipes]